MIEPVHNKKGRLRVPSRLSVFDGCPEHRQRLRASATGTLHTGQEGQELLATTCATLQCHHWFTHMPPLLILSITKGSYPPLPLRTSLPYGLKRAVSSGMAEINNLTTYVNGAEATGTSHTPMPSRPRARTQGRRLAARAPIADGRLYRHPAPRPLSTRLEQPLADTRRVHGGMVAQLCQNRRDRNARRHTPAPRGEEASCSGSDC